MARRIAIGVAWWLAAAYAFQFGAFMYGFPPAAGLLAAIPLAVLIAATRPSPNRRPADLRRIHRPTVDGAGTGGEPAILG